MSLILMTMAVILKEWARGLMRCTPLYLKTRKQIGGQNTVILLAEAVNNAIDNVPYYRSKFIRDFSEFDILRKSDIIGREKELVSERKSSYFLRKVETGGSTGVSLSLFRALRDVIQDIAYTDFVFSFIGKDLKIAELRGRKPYKNRLWQKVTKNKILLSSYSLSEKNLDLYLSLLQQHKINCIHAYPSSLTILARLIKSKYGVSPLTNLKGILTSSEVFSKQNQLLVSEVFPGVKLVDYYSHNEQACCAYSIDMSPYNFIGEFGFVEFVPNGETINGNIVAEIVATSIMNKTMPFIRYGTEDYVELDSNGSVLSIIGRSCEYVVNEDNDVVPCIVLIGNNALKHVINFQYFQNKPGVLGFRVVVRPDFSKEDIGYICRDINDSFDGKMIAQVEVVEEISKTRSGKQKRLIQNLHCCPV